MELTAGHSAELTPAQTAFLESSINNFRINEWNVELAGQAASARKFFRVSKGSDSYILVEWNGNDEDWPRFLGVGSYVLSLGIDILPRVYASDPVFGLILEEDLGDVTLKKFCADNGGNTALIENMYRRVIDAMRQWHGIDICNCQFITSRTMDIETFLWESDYFARHCVVDFFGKEDLLSGAWEGERRRMAERAASLPRVNMHRDFQSENVLIHNNRVRFVDFQGARLGPAHYDAASLLFDPYITQLEGGAAERLLDHYLATGGSRPGPSSPENDFYVCAAQRLMQALGAYGNLSCNLGKPRYRRFIPVALERLSLIFDKKLPEFPAMGHVLSVLRY